MTGPPLGDVRNPGKLARFAAWYRLHDKPALAEAIEAQLLAAKRCKMCGRPLSDELSIRRGLGPDCLAKLTP